MRILTVVINQLLTLIPEEEENLIFTLKAQADENRYRAPEIADWKGVADDLWRYLRGREEEPWVDALLAVWTDQPDAMEKIIALKSE
jgi:hypothetical protein